MLAFDASDKI